MKPIKISAYTVSSALGLGLEKNLKALQLEKSGLKPCDFFGIQDLNTWIGEVPGIDNAALPDRLSRYECRNNRLAYLALQQDDFISKIQHASNKYGSNRVAIFIGTSTSGIHETEKAYIERDSDSDPLPETYDFSSTHCVFSCADFISQLLELKGLSYVISTACSSSAKVFASAQRAIQSGLCDAALVGGVDSLCLTTLYGFNALQVISQNPCKPSDQYRDGISIGEAAGFALLEKTNNKAGFGLIGYGESSDAYHMSRPHPKGNGASQAMNDALKSGGLTPKQISYVNLHGTATPANDHAEALAVHSIVGRSTPCSSTKAWTGHTLGAAGIIEVIFSIFSLEHQWIPKSLNTENVDPEIEINILTTSMDTKVDYIISNSFGFGGSNCSLALGRVN